MSSPARYHSSDEAREAAAAALSYGAKLPDNAGVANVGPIQTAAIPNQDRALEAKVIESLKQALEGIKQDWLA